VDFERGFITIRRPEGGQRPSYPDERSGACGSGKSPPHPRKPVGIPGRFPGQHKHDAWKSIDRIRKAAQLPEGFRPLHGLRHTFASMLASSGAVDMYTLQKLLTHKSPLMTQRYAHLRDEHAPRLRVGRRDRGEHPEAEGRAAK